MSVERALRGYPAEIRRGEPMARHTSLGVGGPAEAMVFPSRIEEVMDLVDRSEAEGVSLFPLGCGSNLLIRDGGIRGIVVDLSRMSACREIGEARIEAEGGMRYPRLSIWAQERGYSGLEFAVGIPGTVGGAVVMNAGIGRQGDGVSETKEVFEGLTLVGKGGKRIELSKTDVPFAYRSAGLPWGIVVSVRFQLVPSNSEAVQARMRMLLDRRRRSQPLDLPSVGSVFKNPPGDFAGRLIEAAGLKGTVEGGAEISNRHGNFIVNRGGARANDVLALIDRARRIVQERFGVLLELEVRVEGTDAPGTSEASRPADREG